MKNKLFLMSVLIFTMSCASTVKRHFNEREHGKLEKDYIVKDASFNFRPGWIASLKEWQKRSSVSQDKILFTNESSRKDLDLSCALSKAMVLKKVAERKKVKSDYLIKSDVQNEYGETISRENLQLKESLSTELSGVTVEQEYWEKRKMDSGEIVYSCAVLVSTKGD
jgi:ribosomal protein S24E